MNLEQNKRNHIYLNDLKITEKIHVQKNFFFVLSLHLHFYYKQLKHVLVQFI